ncbi:MAG: NHLP bacteriocin export ABC transporter permease/ATPase subunit [Candidatus Obscuribacterales bacterium]|nr:NHLP bacteriocin export ABC transporter permease/ATPase subunit [Candidatus Obscuribacterales bacterium]
MPISDDDLIVGSKSGQALGEASTEYMLEKSGTVIAVLEGMVSIFSQEKTETGNPGRRHYLFDRSAGDFIFPIPGAVPPWLMIHDQAKIEVLPAAKFYELKEKNDNETIIRAIDEWIQTVSSSLLDQPPPVAPAVLSPGVSCCLLAGQEAAIENGILWAQIKKGSCFFLGQEQFPISAGAPPFPLTTSSWLFAAQETELRVITTELLLENKTIKQSLDGFHTIMAGLWEETIASTNLKKQEDAAERDLLDQGNFRRAVNRFQEILTPKTLKHEISAPGTALFRACRLLGKINNVDFRLPTRIRKSKQNEDAISEIAFESRCRYRFVHYEKDWWLHDYGPLLGFKGEEHSPVALIPGQSSNYVCIDPESGTSEIVDEKLAKSLGKTAIVFYRSLPDTPQNAWQILRFSTTGLRKEFIQVWTSSITAGLFSLALPLLAGKIFSQTIPSANYQELHCLVSILTAICLGQTVFHIIRLLNLSRIEQKSGNDLEAAVWDRLLRLPVPFFRQFTVGDLMDRTMSVEKLRQNVTRTGHSILNLLIIAICNLALMFRYDGSVALIIVILAFVGLLLLLSSTTARAKIEKERMRISGQFVALSLDIIGHVSKLRLAGADLRALSLWANKAAEYQRLSFSAANIEAAITSEISLTPLACTALLFASIATFTPNIMVEDFITFNIALGQFLAALLTIYERIPDLYLLQPMFQRLQPLLEAVPEQEQNATDPGILKGAIELQSVSVSYETGDETILSDISFRIKPGEFVAIVGKSGSGKSTILRTLIGFEKPMSGSVFIDGKDLTELDLRSVRKQMGVVLQNDKLVPGSVFLNIVGNSDLTKDDAWEAAEMSGLADDIRSWPMGMDTSLMEGAGTISGGQKQRLLVARAIVRKPRILILDEATSALDNKTQTTIIQSLRRLNATRIVVAQRLSTVQNTDRIYVVDQGRIVEVGTFKQLMAANGKFAELAQRQLA